jgi:signal transduction histidine kinase/ligand-binding sensor domain-containing protein
VAFGQYHFDSWTADDGLPQNIVTAIHQSRDGYLWIATLDGLARFDGVRFTVFNRSNSSGISSNRFTTLYEDAQGDLWLGTEGGSVTRYAAGRFVTFGTANGLPAKFIRTLVGDAAGNLLVLCGDEILQWQTASERFVPAESAQRGPEYFPLEWNDRPGFWAIDHNVLRVFVNGRWERHSVSASFTPSHLAVSQDGTIWFVDSTGHVAALEESSKGELVGTTASTPPPRSQSRVEAQRIAWRDRHAISWALGVVDGLRRSMALTSSDRVSTMTFSVLFEDREGNLWLGTDGQGLHRVRKEVVKTYSEPEGLVSRNVYPIFEDRAGAIWIGAWAGGLSRVQGGRITNYTTKDGLRTGAVTALMEDRDGVLWVATHSGLQQFRNGRFFAPPDDVASAARHANVIHQDREGALWFGTDEGVVRYLNGQVSRFTMRDGLASDMVRVIIDTAGGLWFGCYGGLTRWKDGTFTSWTQRDGLPGTLVRALYEDPAGTLWIGTYDSGLARFRDGRFTRFSTRDGLYNDGVFQILEDSRRNLWMSSNRGIFRVRKQELEEFAAGHRFKVASIAYGKADGMLNIECNGGLAPAGVKARDGRLWFPTQDGAAVIDPASISDSQPPPPVVIESLSIDREPLNSSGLTAPVRLEPGWQNVEIHYTGLSFVDPEHMRFRYKLAGLDRDWIEAGTRRTAYYSHAPPGRYVFTVEAAHYEGEWSSQAAIIVLDVLPPFYRTWWFLTAVALGAVALLAAGHRYRVSQLTRAQAAQQAFSRELIASQERERRRIARELHDSLGQSLAIIKNRALLSLTTPEDHGRALEQLKEISDASTDAIAEVREIAHNLRPYHLDRLGLTKAIEATVGTVAATHGLPFAVELDRIDGLLAPDAEINLFRIVQESVNNVLAHANATEAAVRIKKNGHTIEVTIEDNGRGFDRHQPPPPDQKRRGFGLVGMTERARLLGAALKIRSAPGGTAVTLAIDLEDQAWRRPPSE